MTARADATAPDPIDILARTIYGEARGESRAGREAVAATVMNRVRRAQEHSARNQGAAYWWGNTVAGVCLKTSQFSCWNPQDPNRRIITGVDARDHAFAECVEIATAAVAGTLPDPTGGATHYHTNAVEPKWALGREPSAKIGAHRFHALG